MLLKRDIPNMANIIDFSIYQEKEKDEQTPPEDMKPSEELGAAIQTLIQQLRNAPF